MRDEEIVSRHLICGPGPFLHTSDSRRFLAGLLTSDRGDWQIQRAVIKVMHELEMRKFYGYRPPRCLNLEHLIVWTDQA